MEKLLCINNFSTDPYFNLATEEYLLKNKTDNVFMLWCNEPVVVVGKHQNIQTEVNHEFIENNDIKIARRLSGGGTVYHDLENLNFTYIMNGEDGKLVDFKKYTNDILTVLNEMGVPAERNERNDLLVNNKKISGNAEHIFKRRVIHHGTLLFNSDLDMLNEAINAKQGPYSDKAVQSVRSKVTNISEYLDKKQTLDELRINLMEFVLNKYSNAKSYELQNDEKEEITELKEQKYKTWDWIYGYSPKYSLKRKIEKPEGKMEIELFIKKGNISKINFSGDLLSSEEMLFLNNLLQGQQHDQKYLKTYLRKTFDSDMIKSISIEELIQILF